MNAHPLYAPLAFLAQHFSRAVHWEKGDNGPRPIRDPLRVEHLRRHLGGGRAVGLAPVAPDSNDTRVAILDFDGHHGVSWETMCATVEMVMRRLQAEDYKPIAFRSSGGHGIHVYILWGEPQDAYSVREMLREVLAACGLKPGTKGLEHGTVEVNPKQNEVAPGRFGNMVILPWSGQSEYLELAE